MVTKIDFPPTLNYLYDYCFYDCLNLFEITIPSEVTSIDKGCFSGCSNLQKVNFSPDSKISRIDNGAFSSTAIESISISSSVTDINETAFINCHKLKSVEIPIDSQLVSIRKSFLESSSIELIYLPSNLKTLEKGCS